MDKPRIDWAEAYRLYMDGLPLKEICTALDIRFSEPKNIGRHLRAYASKHLLPYPRTPPREYAYNLYKNGMKTHDIALFFSVAQTTIQSWITTYGKQMGDFSPLSKSQRAEFSYKLKTEQGLTYARIAKLLGYSNRNTCYRAILNYKRKIGLHP